MKLVLASASPRRQELLRLITEDFTVCPADVDETIPADISPQAAARYLAEIKAKAIAAQFPDAVIIGSDTTVLLEDTILGKPETPERTAEMLRRLSGTTHEVITGVALAQGKRCESFCTVTKVKFYKLTETKIQQYIATGEPLDKAGGYGIQGYGALFVESLNGDYYSVVGLPIAPLARALEQWERLGNDSYE